MASIELFQKQFEMILWVRGRIVEGISDSEATWQPKPELPSIAWHVAHTLYTEACGFLGSSKGDWSFQQKPWVAVIKMGSKLPADLKGLPKLSQLMAERTAQHAAVLTHLQSLAPEQRGAKMPHMKEGVLPPMLQSVNDCMMGYPIHDSHHNGEISLLRRMLGKPGVM